jgi:hypothetical protein
MNIENIESPRLQLGEFVFSDAKRVLQQYGQKRKSPWVCAMSAPNRPDLLRSSVRRAQMVDMQIRNRKRGANSGPSG